MFRSRASLALLVCSVAWSSGENRKNDTAAEAVDTTAQAAAAAPTMFASAGATDRMKGQNLSGTTRISTYFDSNINGNPTQKDGNGFIAKVNAGNTSAMTHPGHDQIIKLTVRKPTVAVKSDSALKAPNGIA